MQMILHRLTIRLHSLLLLVFLPLAATAIGNRMMEDLTLNDGLAGETVRRIMTDRHGLTWIATSSGVNVYDGRKLLAHPILNEQGQPLDVFDLCETTDHSIYAATDGGLYRLAVAHQGFERVLPEVSRPISLLAVDDTVYIGGEQGLQIYDGNQLKQQDVGASRKGLDNVVRCYLRDDKGLIWFLGRHNLNSYNPATGKIEHYELADVMGGKRALSRFSYADGKFFIGTLGSGLFVYDPLQRDGHVLPAVGKVVTSVRTSADGLIAVATDGTGAFLIAPQTEQVVNTFTMDVNSKTPLSTNAVYDYYRDANGVNWFGFVRYGLSYTLYNCGLFQCYESDGFSTFGMNVRCFQIRGSESVIGLQDGLWYVDSQRHLRHYFSAEELGGHIVNNIQYWKGKYYIGMFDGGVRILDTQSLKILHQPFSPLLERTTVGDIKIAPDSSLWIGCSDGLFIIPVAGDVPAAGAIRQFTELNSPIIGGIVISITFDRQGNAWLTGAKGVSLYSAASGEVVEARFPNGFWNTVPYLRGAAGHDGITYMRSGPQLFYTTEQMRDYGELSLPIQLTDKWCRSMVDNGKGKLLLASERGLLLFDYEGKNMIQLGAGEGLHGNNISELQLDANGLLWVATNQGLYTAREQDVNEWLVKARFKVILNSVWKGNDPLSMKEMSILVEEHTIQLSWNIYSQVLQARALLPDYAPQKGRLYEWRVDGGKWQLVDSENQIDIRQLLLGRHTLEVRQAGAPGTASTYVLHVVPSAWAWIELILLLLLLASAVFAYRYRKNTRLLLSERNEIEDALIESEELRAKSEEYAAALDDTAQKYNKVKIDEEECADIVRRMKEYLERERVYTNADLKMKDLAGVLHLSAPKLSQVFNLYLKENYYEFINRYRLEEFKRLIDAGEYKRYTITALSEQCGFKKSNFFSTFRKVEGLTPVEYLKKQGVKV